MGMGDPLEVLLAPLRELAVDVAITSLTNPQVEDEDEE